MEENRQYCKRIADEIEAYDAGRPLGCHIRCWSSSILYDGLSDSMTLRMVITVPRYLEFGISMVQLKYLLTILEEM